ncbi:hypothetical protein [Marinomonas sp. PE14-40]|uniref:hypothetical protein n=1 Tax=Marinomonas sp. PE14-40 TaxID=3060621 RepID=UPI003F675C04
MEAGQTNLRKGKCLFGWVFVLSSFVFFVPDLIGQMFQHSAMQGSIWTHKIDPIMDRFTYNSPSYLAFSGVIILSMLNVLTVIFSCIVFAFVSLLVWKKDKHVALSVKQEAQKLESILADLQLELDQRR